MNRRAGNVARGVAAIIATACVSSASTSAAEIRVICSNNMQRVLSELAPKFEAKTGHKLVLEFGNAGAVQSKVLSGVVADVVVVQKPSLDELQKAGKLTAGSVSDVAHSPMVIFLKSGTQKLPDIGTAATFTRRLLDAKSVSYPNPANRSVSGLFLGELFERLGISQQLLPKARLARNTAESVEHVLSGEAELGMSQQSEISNSELVMSRFPNEIGGSIVLSAAVLANPREATAARALVAYLSSSESAGVIRAHRLESIRP